MNYEAWRITFQSSEQAARAAFAEWQKRPAECEPVAWTTRQQIERLKNPAYDGTIPMAMWKAKVYEQVTIPLYTTPQPCPKCAELERLLQEESQQYEDLRQQFDTSIAEITSERDALQAKVAELTKESEYYSVNRDIAGKAYLDILEQRNEYAEKITELTAERDSADAFSKKIADVCEKAEAQVIALMADKARAEAVIGKATVTLHTLNIQGGLGYTNHSLIEEALTIVNEYREGK